jgi:hypothetical protein
MVHHPEVALFLALSACLGEAQIKKTPANQAIKRRNTDELFFCTFTYHWIST